MISRLKMLSLSLLTAICVFEKAQALPLLLSDPIQSSTQFNQIGQWISTLSEQGKHLGGIDVLTIKAFDRDPDYHSLFAKTTLRDGLVRYPYEAQVQVFANDFKDAHEDANAFLLVLSHELAHHHDLLKLGVSRRTSEVKADWLAPQIFLEIIAALPGTAVELYLKQKELIPDYLTASGLCSSVKRQNLCVLGLLAAVQMVRGREASQKEFRRTHRSHIFLQQSSSDKFSGDETEHAPPQCRLDLLRSAFLCLTNGVDLNHCAVPACIGDASALN